MRILPAALAALVTLALLAGCSGDDDTSTTTTTDGHDHSTTTTAAAPNVPPVVSLMVTDGNGTATNTTFVGGTLLFDASASTDPDGDGIAAIAIVAIDVNTTYEAQLLYTDGAYSTVEYTFLNPGPVNITVSAVDRRGGVTTIGSVVFVNERLVLGDDKTFQGFVPEAAASARSCKGPSGQAAADALVWARHDFAVQNGTTYVTATVLSGSAEIAICAADGTPVSPESTTTVRSDPATAFTPGTYFVSVYSGAANAKAPVEVVIHYDAA